MKATRTFSVRLVTLGGAIALATAGLVGPVAVIGAGEAAAAGTVTQLAPTKGSATLGKAFSDQLQTSGNVGQVTFVTDSSTQWGTVSSTGVVSVPGTAPKGSYILFGTDSDGSGGQGQWQYILTVTSISITQSTPKSGSVATIGSAAFTDQLTTTDKVPVTFTTTGGAAGLTVSSSGKVTTTGTLSVGPHTANGTTADAFGGAGTFTYTLTVSTVPITQTTPKSGSVATIGSAAFTDQLTTTGNSGPVTFTGGGGGLTVSSSGSITTTGTLLLGTYTATGTTADAFGDTGTFAYSLTVSGITQAGPTSGSVTRTGSAAFTDQLNTTGNNGAVTFTGGGTGLTISSNGSIATTGTLAAGSYTATGTTADAFGETGSFTYTLIVGAITLTTPTSGSVTTTGSAAFTNQLSTIGNIGPVTFAGSGAGLTVSSSGSITTTGTQAVGTYAASGTTADAFGDTGTFTYTLTVSPVLITQNTPNSGSVTTSRSAAFTDQLNTNGNIGPVTFTGSGAGLTVSSSGSITATGTQAVGTYTATGTTNDAFGDTGTITYTLTVTPVTIAQITPTSGAQTVAGSAGFTDQLNTTGNIGPVTFTGVGAGLKVSSNGSITTSGTLAVGTYKATGTTADAFGDAGTFTYTLTVSPVLITQNTPNSGSVTTIGSAAFTDQLSTTGNIGAVTFAGSGAGLTVSSNGSITTSGTLVVATHKATGTISDAFGDTGTFSYSLTVNPVLITQTSSTSGSVTTTGSGAFTNQLTTTGNIGAVTFAGSGAGLTVSSSGWITATGTQAVGTYTATGTTNDAFGDTGTITYTLTVTPVTIAQITPTSGAQTVAGSAGFTDQLNTTGNIGPVTFTGVGAGLKVSSNGSITTSGTLAVGTYKATGTTADAFGDVGTFTYTLAIGTIAQTGPTSGSVTTTGSAGFTDQLGSTGNSGTVTYAMTAGAVGLTVSPSGKVTTTGTLVVGTSAATGTISDAFGDTGTFTYALTVNPVPITQTSPTSGSVTTTGSAAFTDQLSTIGNIGPVTFTGGGAGLTISSNGSITTTGTLAVGTYKATGTTADAFGDTGTFTYALTVNPVPITQTSPTSGSVTTTGSAAFTDQLTTIGNIGPVTFTGGGAGLTISSNGKVTTTGTLAVGTYKATGTTADAFGDTGKFTYALTVNPASVISQTSPTSGLVTTTGSAAFTDQLTTIGNNGTVTFAGGGAGLTVSASGKVTTTGILAVGTYRATGTTADAFGHAGTFTYALTVSSEPVSLPFTGATGYTMVASDGGIFNYGDATFYGSAGATPLNKPIVGMAATADGKGYWMVASDGGIFNYGDAAFYGSAGATPLNKPIVGMAASADGKGYWMVASDGGIFNYGDAAFYGSAGATPLNKPIVGMAASADGKGYWMVASDGGIFNYGDAAFYGSAGATPLNKPIVGMAASADGKGYWMVASDGGIFNYGDAAFYGSAGATPLNKPIVGMAATADGKGYWMVASDGGIFNYGDAAFYGSAGATPLNKPIVGIAKG